MSHGTGSRAAGHHGGKTADQQHPGVHQPVKTNSNTKLKQDSN